MSKPRTLVLSVNTSWNVYNFRLGLLHALKKDGYDIIIVAPEDAYTQKLRKLGFSCYTIEMNNKGTDPKEELKLLYRYYQFYKKISPDVILQYTIKPNIYGSIAAGLLRIPVISNISGFGTVFLDESISSRVARFLYRIALRFPQRVFFQNSVDMETFIQKGLVQKELAVLLPGSGIDTEKFKPCKSDSEEKEVPVKFLFIARLVKDKGILEYVQAAKEIKSLLKNSVQCDILGAFYPGNPTAVTEEDVCSWERENIISYLGTTDNVQSVICEYDSIVLPSYREGLSRVLLEAASMAKPIVTTDVPGCREVVEDGVNGFLCKVKDIDSLSDAMVRMATLSPEERRKMGEMGREKVLRTFSEEKVIAYYKKALSEIL